MLRFSDEHHTRTFVGIPAIGHINYLIKSDAWEYNGPSEAEPGLEDIISSCVPGQTQITNFYSLGITLT